MQLEYMKMMIKDFISDSGELMPDAIGRQFYGRKRGTCRTVTEIKNHGHTVKYISYDVRIGECGIAAFRQWVSALVPSKMAGDE